MIINLGQSYESSQNSQWITQPQAFVAGNEGAKLEERDLLQFVRDRLADYKVPRKVVVLPALPRNATGKILKTSLRTMPVTE